MWTEDKKWKLIDEAKNSSKRNKLYKLKHNPESRTPMPQFNIRMPVQPKSRTLQWNLIDKTNNSSKRNKLYKLPHNPNSRTPNASTQNLHAHEANEDLSRILPHTRFLNHQKECNFNIRAVIISTNSENPNTWLKLKVASKGLGEMRERWMKENFGKNLKKAKVSGRVEGRAWRRRENLPLKKGRVK